MLTGLAQPASSLTLLSSSHDFPQPLAAHRNMTDVAPLHGGINILLGGAMMGGMLVVVFCICYCCHKRVQKTDFPEEAESRSDQWLQTSDESDSNIHIFTLDGQQCYEGEGLFNDTPSHHNSPPPSYHDVIESEDPNLPSYEEALRLQQPPRCSTIYMDQLAYI